MFYIILTNIKSIILIISAISPKSWLVIVISIRDELTTIILIGGWLVR